MLLIDEVQPYQADEYSGDLGHRDGFLVEQRADEDQDDRQERALHDGCRAHAPARAVRIDEPDFQPDQHKTEHERRPVQLVVFLQDARVPVQDVEHEERKNRTHDIGDGKGRKGVHSRRNLFGADLIKDVGQYDQADRPDIIEHRLSPSYCGLYNGRIPAVYRANSLR